MWLCSWLVMVICDNELVLLGFTLSLLYDVSSPCHPTDGGSAMIYGKHSNGLPYVRYYEFDFHFNQNQYDIYFFFMEEEDSSFLSFLLAIITWHV
jgi:hypothetical protein